MDDCNNEKKVSNAEKQRTAPQFSRGISAFLQLLDDAEKDYRWNMEQEAKMDALTQDYLHKLELEDLTYHQRAKIAVALTKCRKERRAHKDTVQVLEPLVTFLESEKGKVLFNLLREALGKTRKIEVRMENRVYYPRALEEKPIHDKGA